jgi:probable HAF family extracellular repeat protein
MKTPRRFASFLTVTVALLSGAVAAQLRVVDLGALPDAQFSQAWAINNRGQIAGSSGGSEGIDQHAALWSDGEWIDLGTLSGHTFSLALGINKPRGRGRIKPVCHRDHESGPVAPGRTDRPRDSARWFL